MPIEIGVVFAFLVVALALESLNSDMEADEKRKRKKVKKFLDKYGMGSVSELFGFVADTKKKNWQRKDGFMIYQPFPYSYSKAFFRYYKSADGCDVLDFCIGSDRCLSMTYNNETSKCKIVNPYDDSLSKSFDALKCRNLIARISSIYEEVFREDIKLREQEVVEEREKRASWFKEMETELLDFLNCLSFEHLENESSSDGFCLMVHDDHSSSYATVFYEGISVFQAMKDEKEFQFMLLNKDEAVYEVLEKHEEDMVRKMHDFLTTYRLNVPNLAFSLLGLCEQLESQKEWLNMDEIALIHSIKNRIKNTRNQKDRMIWPVLFITQKHEACLSLLKEVEKRKIRAIHLHKELIKVRTE